VVTTNYDKVLRWASPQERDLRHWTVSDRVNLVEIHRDCVGQPAVWHLHGFIDRPEEIILTPDGYSMLYPTAGQIQVDYEAALVTLRHLLTARTFLFIGFGMEEAIQRQIRWVRETFGGAGGKHFVLVKADAQEAMEKELHGLSVQPVPFADFGQPLLDLLGELASHADSGGLRTPAPLPRVEADPRPYLEYLRNDTAFIEIRGLRLNVAEAPRFPIDDLYIPLIDEMGSGREMESGRARRTLDESLAHTRLVILGDPGSGKTTFLRRIAHAAARRGSPMRRRRSRSCFGFRSFLSSSSATTGRTRPRCCRVCWPSRRETSASRWTSISSNCNSPGARACCWWTGWMKLPTRRRARPFRG
jgi:hypothetical protein